MRLTVTIVLVVGPSLAPQYFTHLNFKTPSPQFLNSQLGVNLQKVFQRSSKYFVLRVYSEIDQKRIFLLCKGFTHESFLVMDRIYQISVLSDFLRRFLDL